MKKWIVTGFVGVMLFSHGQAQQAAAKKKTETTKTTAAKGNPDNEKSFELAGAIAGLTSPKIMLRYETGGKMRIDTAIVFNGSFVFRGTVDGPTFSQMMSTDFTFSHNQYLENAKMTITKKDTTSDVAFSGSATEDENTVFNKYKSALGDKIYLLRQELQKLSETDAAAAEKRSKTELIPLYDSMNLKIESYVKEHPKSLVSLIELSKIAGGIDTKELGGVFSGLDKSLQESATGKGIAASIESRLKTEVGVVAIPFTQKNDKGEDISLTSFKGKYLLIDFWASWCGPCRAENPNVVKSFNKYKDKGFMILGVSLDQDSTKWKAAIEKDSLGWAQVSDLKGWQNAVAVQYGIQAIPANFLVGPDGVIIAKDLRGEALEQKLAELLDK
ncbi:MAG TPA: TlpA disulfide reductase family protein [Puia sp.]|nr:TlpA disulfide reductase family protein [Puia sp.]